MPGCCRDKARVLCATLEQWDTPVQWHCVALSSLRCTLAWASVPDAGLMFETQTMSEFQAQDHPEEMATLLGQACSQDRKPSMIFVGATISEQLTEQAVKEVSILNLMVEELKFEAAHNAPRQYTGWTTCGCEVYYHPL